MAGGLEHKKIVNLQLGLCFGLILINFIAQMPYFYHLYAGRQSLALDLRSFAVMGAVFAWFIGSAILLSRGRRSGYWLMVGFLATEFLFYLYNNIGSVRHGFGLFFQVDNPDLLLRMVYSIGYVNLFASGYGLALLIWQRNVWLS